MNPPRQMRAADWSRFWLALFLFASVVKVAAVAPELLTSRESSLVLPVVGNGSSTDPRISADGRFVVFSSSANNLVTNDNGHFGLDVFLRDRTSNTKVLISENLQKTGGGNDHSTALAASTNGRYVLFESIASDLVAGDTNGLRDVFIRDLANNTTFLISTNSRQAMRNFSITGPLLSPEAPVVTPDGRYVAFVNSNDLSAGVVFTTTLAGYGSVGEVCVGDLIAGVTTWVSSNAFSLAYSNLAGTKFLTSYHPSISTDGRYVAFKTSFADRAGITAIFRKDLATDELVLISTNGIPQGNGLRTAVVDEIFGPEMSSDGRFVAYGNRVNGTNFYSIHVWDGLAGTNYLISGSPAWVAQTNAHSYAPVFSADGRYVAFISDATNLVANTVASGPHLYRRDLVANVTELLDVSQGGAGMLADFIFEPPSLSADGQWAAFSAVDGDFVTEDSGGFEDVFVRDVAAGTNELISVPNGALTPVAADAAALPGLLSMSADGGRVAFSTIASNQIAGDDNREADIFVWDRAGQSNQLVSVGLDALGNKRQLSKPRATSSHKHDSCTASGKKHSP